MDGSDVRRKRWKFHQGSVVGARDGGPNLRMAVPDAVGDVADPLPLLVVVQHLPNLAASVERRRSAPDQAAVAVQVVEIVPVLRGVPVPDYEVGFLRPPGL